MELWTRAADVGTWTYERLEARWGRSDMRSGGLEILGRAVSVAMWRHRGMELWRRAAGVQRWRRKGMELWISGNALQA